MKADLPPIFRIIIHNGMNESLFWMYVDKYALLESQFVK